MAKNKDPSQSRYTPSSCFRNYTFLLYPESAVEDWYNILNEMQVPAVISPLHTGEKENGEPLKPHYHIVLMYSQKHSIAQALEVISEIKGVPNLTNNYKKFVVGDLKKMLRYLCHLDEGEDKPKYPITDVRVLGPINYEAAIQVDDDIIQTLIDITFFVHINHMCNFAEFMCWCGENNKSWFEIASTKATYYIATLIKTEGYSDGSV